VRYTSFPAFGDIVMSVKVISVRCLSSRSTRCGTLVPQPLAVMNSVKAKDRKRFVAGKRGVRGLIKKGFAPSFLILMTFGVLYVDRYGL